MSFNKRLKWFSILLTFMGCLIGCSNMNIQRHLVSKNRIEEGQKHSGDAGWYCIKGEKKKPDVDNGYVLGSYKLQVDTNCDLNDIVRNAYKPTNRYSRKIKCNIKLEHPKLSDILVVTRNVPCTITGWRVDTFKRLLDERTGTYVDYPGYISEIWGICERRFLCLPKRYDISFKLSIKCFENQETAAAALAIDRLFSDMCYGLSVSDNIVFNISVQCDYFVGIDVIIITYKGADGKPTMAGLID